jgi:adenylate kinase
VVLLDVALDDLMKRLTGRRTCKDCGSIYNVYYSPSKNYDECDVCRGPLFQRADDNEETIGNRLNVYQESTQPLIGYYETQGKLHTIPGTGDVNQITEAVGAIFDTI